MSSDEEDWEKQLDDENELDKNVNDKEKNLKFKNEDNYDSEEERKKKKI